jgi:hypothetical protein
MSFQSAAYAVVARVFELLDSNGFTRILFSRFSTTSPNPSSADWYGLAYSDPTDTPTDSAAIGFLDRASAPGQGPTALIKAASGPLSSYVTVADEVRSRVTDGVSSSELVLQPGQFRVDAQSSVTLQVLDPNVFNDIRLIAQAIELGLGAQLVNVNGSNLYSSERLTANPTLAVTLVGAAQQALANTVVIPTAPYERIARVSAQNLFAPAATGSHDYYVVASGGVALSPRTRWNLTTATSLQSSNITYTFVIPPNVAPVTLTVTVARVSAATNMSTVGGADLNRLEVNTYRSSL